MEFSAWEDEKDFFFLKIVAVCIPTQFQISFPLHSWQAMVQSSIIYYMLPEREADANSQLLRPLT